MGKGQISLEFLIVLFAMMAVLLVFMPVFSRLYKSILLAVDVYNGSNYLQEFKTNVSMLSTLDVGSSFTIDMGFIRDVNFSCKNNKATLKIESKLKSKELYADLPLNCTSFSKTIQKKQHLLVSKTDNNNLNIFVG